MLGAASKDVGISDSDIVAATKLLYFLPCIVELLFFCRGRSYTFIPDATDRRVLRLCIRRIQNSFKYRKENQEAIFGKCLMSTP